MSKFMKKLLVVLLILIASIVVSGCGGSSSNNSNPPAPTTETCTLSVSLGTGNSDISVKVIGGTKTYQGTTDAAGNATISSIPTGKYFIRYAKEGFAAAYILKTLKSGINEVQGKLSTWEDMNGGIYAGIFDSSNGNVIGSVFGTDGKTRLSGVSVSVSPAPKKMYYMAGGALSDTATATDESGLFVAVLTNGTYTLTPSGAGQSFDPVQLTISEPCVFMGLKLNAK
jgi:hypothetical protein